MYQITVLVVEDEARIRKLIKRYLIQEGYAVLEVATGEEALDIFETEQVDLVVLDWMLPEMNGDQVGKKIRETSQIPIIMLTARSSEEDKLYNFDIGVDDYMTKPFSTRELVARIKALLKRTNRTKTSDQVTIGEISINMLSRRIFLKGEEVVFTPKEYDCLLYFIDNVGRALSREQILNRVWGTDYYGDDRTVDTVVKRIRKKLGEEGKRLQTVRGIGYRFEG